MVQLKRTFKVIELGKSAATEIRMPTTTTVEVIDITTRIKSHMQAANVSMYRHKLQWDGKIFNILGITERY